MLRLSRGLCGLYVPVVGCIFLVDTLYGCKYSPHIGVCNLPYVYVKALLFCASGQDKWEPKRKYVHGLIEYLVPFNREQDSLTKLELMQFVDTVPPRAIKIHTASTVLGSAQLSLTHSTSALQQSASTSGAILRSSGGGPPSVTENVTSFLSGALLPAALARVLLYDAVCTCADDDEYDESERHRVSQVAEKLGIPQRVRDAIEKVVVQERLLAMRKRRLLLLTDTPPTR
ncbi:hypothetical protein C3747_53g104 [Trypanosoma cruzi]|uniref:Uncharacterized protein n=2 Tax=Trypanosoma cruzi TaxID=5693 RepID=Q4DEX6_TRYCC|nr:hypothetical protein, conserved [Trypanosoma cruzi]EAN91069.1 hypothetical protein, conserved [Trypanosoma cruzi]PWV12237.1 hypothetical protein C3747_53g104 [Trypanosoma cruzi]|eukprot:XP_812920.1 hypothetical protein [Trypanosoma cruzi strain CL Brener]